MTPPPQRPQRGKEIEKARAAGEAAYLAGTSRQGCHHIDRRLRAAWQQAWDYAAWRATQKPPEGGQQ